MVANDGLGSLQGIIESQEEGRSRIQALRLFHNMFGMDSSSTIGSGDLSALLSTAFLASEHIDEISADGGFRLQYASFGAEVFEDVGNIFPEHQDSMVLSYLTYSSLNYLLTRRFANSRLLAEAALERTPDIAHNMETPDQFRLAIHKASLCFLAARLDDLKAITSSVNTRRIARDMVGRVHFTELASGLMLLRSIDNFVDFSSGKTAKTI